MRRVFPHLPPPRIADRAGRALAAWLLAVALLLLLGVAAPVRAQGVDLKSLRVERRDGELMLEFSHRLTLSPGIEDALHRGVPLYFTAQATVFRNRWYWRDERVARVSRTWRLAYQPLTANWRLSLGGLSQTHGSLSEALAPMSRVAGWRLLDGEKLEPGERYYLEFSFKLDNSQLPQPMQIDLGGDWKLGIERSLRIE